MQLGPSFWLRTARSVFFLPLIPIAWLPSDIADWLKTEFYFGLSIQTEDGTTIADDGDASSRTVLPEDFTRFLEEEVTPRFPDGLTVVPALGQWLSPVAGSTPVQERSQIVLVYHPDVAGRRQAVLAVVEAYRERFQQEAVLYSSTNTHVCITAADCLSTQFFWNTTELRQSPPTARSLMQDKSMLSSSTPPISSCRCGSGEGAAAGWLPAAAAGLLLAVALTAAACWRLHRQYQLVARRLVTLEVAITALQRNKGSIG